MELVWNASHIQHQERKRKVVYNLSVERDKGSVTKASVSIVIHLLEIWVLQLNVELQLVQIPNI